MTNKQILSQIEMLKDLDHDDAEAIAEEFNNVLVDTKIWHKYEKLNKSYEKYKNDDGWANALFFYFDYDDEDWDNWKEWIKYVYEQEKENLNKQIND